MTIFEIFKNRNRIFKSLKIALMCTISIIIPANQSSAMMSLDITDTNFASEISNDAQTIEVGLKILEECLPTDEEGLKEISKLPDKTTLTDTEKNIYDEIENTVQNIIKGVDSDSTPVSKQLKIANAIYCWVANNIKYTEAKQENAFEVFKNRGGICRGYSRLNSLMMRMAGTPCICIGAPAHSFNAVYIEDVKRKGWTLMDTTWAAPHGYELDLFNPQKTTESNYEINDEFMDIISYANSKDKEDTCWDYVHEVKTKLNDVIMNHISSDNIKQINKELSKKISEINQKAEYNSINKFLEIKINPDNKPDLEEPENQFLARLKLVSHVSEDAQNFVNEENEENLHKHFPAFYNIDMDFKDANQQILSMESHIIKSLSNVLNDEDFDEDIPLHYKKIRITFSLDDYEENLILCLSYRQGLISIDDETFRELSSYYHGFPIEIGYGIESISLRNEDIDISRAYNLKHISTTNSTRYIVEDETLYEIKDGKKVNWQAITI